MPGRDTEVVNWDEQRLSFGPAAGLYDRVRPRYPVPALRWMLGARPVKVVDLGAGTGILTRQLLDLGHEVLPVEPDAGMRAALDQATPGIRSQAGSAEEIPLPDGAVDAVVAGQAYHWFNRGRAHPEIARVLKPGGVFAPVWNDRDERVEWLTELSALVDDVHGHEDLEITSFGEWFGPVEQADFEFSVPHTPDSVVELMRSRSYYLTAGPERQRRIDEGVRSIAARNGEEFPLPYVTHAFRAAKR